MALSFRNLGLRIERFGTLILPSVRAASSTPQTAPAGDYLKKVEDVASKYSQHISEAVNRWEKCDEVYYGKERDMKNFPTVKYPITHPKVRLGFLPDSWFQALYPKTGVTGIFFMSNIYFRPLPFPVRINCVSSQQGDLGGRPSFRRTWRVCGYSHVAYQTIRSYYQQTSRRRLREQTRYHKPMNALIGNLDKTVSTADEEIARSLAVKDLIKAKEENLDLQLEAAYRERLQQVYRAVHRRLDYHVEYENTKRRFQQQHMIHWVVNNVIQGITPSQEKETLTHCIGELRRLAKMSQAAPSV
ncbi:F-type H+-transporting ATPase subunit b [Fasciola hepatica]|uniref:ATP synthase subunit b n=1 Tax=Fasciola hepatica TaxID=6192 RepID=A0A4E0RGT3_FASHE|nr:F-type H+-transporting ATPase subunit b [Fasciola hepatica]